MNRRGYCISETDREGYTVTRTYDGLGRLKTWTGPLPEHDLVLDYDYDLRSLLIQAIQTYTDGSVAPVTVVSGEFDGYGQLTQEQQLIGGAVIQQFDQSWDGRLEVRQAAVAGGVAETPNIIRSGYDPLVEFLELSVSFDDTLLWKVFGPDANGIYGGLNGIGGLEALVLADAPSTPIYTINDTFGNIIGSVGSEGLEWSKVRVGGYGPLPGIAANRFDEASDLADPNLWAWRTRSVDLTGFINCGARYYEPLGGRFLSPDPLGHGSSMSLYDYANGDPINQVDPDGRFGKMVEENWQEDWNRMSDGFYRRGEQRGEAIYEHYERLINDPLGTVIDGGVGLYDQSVEIIGDVTDRVNNPDLIFDDMVVKYDDMRGGVEDMMNDPGSFSEHVGDALNEGMVDATVGKVIPGSKKKDDEDDQESETENTSDENTPKRPEFRGTDKPWTEGATPNSKYNHLDGDGKVKQTAIYGEDGKVIGHVDYKNHGNDAPSGHGHQFTEPGNPASGHGKGKPHIPNDQLPRDWTDLPSDLEPTTPVGQ